MRPAEPPQVPSTPDHSDEAARPAPTPGYAGRWRRLIAGLIDTAVSYGIALTINIPVWGYHRTMHGGKGNADHQIIVNLIATAIGLAYFAVPHARWGQTLGKRLTSIRVVRTDDTGTIGYGRATWRFIAMEAFQIIADLLGAALAPLALLGLVNLAWILWDPRRQALHDKLAKTTVVNTSPGLPTPRSSHQQQSP